MTMRAWYLTVILGVTLMPVPGRAADGPADNTGKPAGQIVFSSNRSGAWRICTIRADGSGLRQLAQGKPDEQDIDPVFSPDGKSILFTSTRGETVGVWRMTRDGGDLTRIADGDQAEWSPDAKQIALRRNERLYVRELASGRERVLSPADWPHPSGPAWSPDGKTIACACRWDAANALFMLPAAGGEPTKVYDRQPACEPHWAADGSRLVYETETRICTINPDGKKNRPVTFFGGVQRYGRFSPDGRWIVYCQGASERGPWELYVIPSQGGTPLQLTEGGSDMYPDWK
jgi:Tol biopolymer transport system component